MTAMQEQYERMAEQIRTHQNKITCSDLIFLLRVRYVTVDLPYPSKFFLALQSFCCRLSIVLLSYDIKSTLMRLDRRKKIGRVVQKQFQGHIKCNKQLVSNREEGHYPSGVVWGLFSSVMNKEPVQFFSSIQSY